MTTLGLDPHPGSHTVVALDLNGAVLGSLTVLNTSAGLRRLQLFAAQFENCIAGQLKEQAITSSRTS